MAGTEQTTAFRWSDLRQGRQDARDVAERHAHELSRILAVHSLIKDRDAELDEMPDRQSHLLSAAWPEQPLEGFELKSSFGAFVLGRVGLSMVASGQTGLRRKPFTRDSLLEHLEESGVARAEAEVLLSTWTAPSPDFAPSLDGLTASQLAGLAERSLTPQELGEALAQVASSSRDLARLVACLEVTRKARALSAILPSFEELPSEFCTVLVSLASDQVERARQLLEQSSLEGPQAALLNEMVTTRLALANGEVAHLPSDENVPPVAELLQLSGPPPEDTDDLEEDLELSEESLGEDGLEAMPARFWRGFREVPAVWPSSGGASTQDWTRPLVAQHGHVLGLRPWVDFDRGGAVFMEPGVEGVAAMLRPTQWGLRIISAAGQGALFKSHGPSLAGSFDWLVARCSAIADSGRGDLRRAASTLESFEADQVPEREWVRDLIARTGERSHIALDRPQVARALDVVARDLCTSLARTLVGFERNEIE